MKQKFQPPTPPLQSFLCTCVGSGILIFILGLYFNPERAWVSFLMSHFYFLCLALGGLFFAAIQWITGVMWSAPLRRLMEALTAYLPWVIIPFGLLTLGISFLYPWSLPENVQGDLILEGKSGYLNVTFFILRNVLAIALWAFFSYKMVTNSLAQDPDGSLQWTQKNRVLSPLFLIVFALTFTMASFDQIMSLDPHWFSTIFGIYCFSGLFYSTLAALCLLTLHLLAKRKLTSYVNKNHLHDLGKFMFAFTVFWAYIAFSQFMLIWYANLPEETSYYLTRVHGHWKWVTVLLVLTKFVIPFFGLLSRYAKRNPKILLPIACLMLLAQGIDILWMIQPEFYPEGPKLGWIELGIFLGFMGTFVLIVFRFLGRYNVVAIGDPRLEESVHHHHQ